MISLLLAAAAAVQPSPAAPPAAAPSQAEQVAAFQAQLRQRGFSEAGVRAIVGAAPQGAAAAEALQAQIEASVTELRTAAAATPVDVARVSALLRRLDDLSGQMSRLGTDATVRNLQLLSEPDRRVLLESMGLRGNPQAPAAPAQPPR
jgi:hypothetical protein